MCSSQVAADGSIPHVDWFWMDIYSCDLWPPPLRSPLARLNHQTLDLWHLNTTYRVIIKYWYCFNRDRWTQRQRHTDPGGLAGRRPAEPFYCCSTKQEALWLEDTCSRTVPEWSPNTAPTHSCNPASHLMHTFKHIQVHTDAETKLQQHRWSDVTLTNISLTILNIS